MAATRAAEFREETSKKATQPKRRRWKTFTAVDTALQAFFAAAHNHVKGSIARPSATEESKSFGSFFSKKNCFIHTGFVAVSGITLSRCQA
jgi:hypothetical protein